MVAIQTAFEGFAQNLPDKLKAMAKRYDMKIPFGQSGKNDNRSLLMGSYRTGGTPWTIVIDPEGKVRFNCFHITAANAMRCSKRLLRSRRREAVV